MRLILTAYDTQWVELTGLGGKLLITVRHGMKPTMRKFDTPTGHWLVHYSQIFFIVASARVYGYEVEYGTLPTAWQMKAAGARVIVDPPPPREEPPFGKLFITEDAPMEVVQAAYRALAKKHHPDAGGSTEKFQEIDGAYRRILTLRGCG